jgi:hypothetical protein
VGPPGTRCTTSSRVRSPGAIAARGAGRAREPGAPPRERGWGARPRRKRGYRVVGTFRARPVRK